MDKTIVRLKELLQSPKPTQFKEIASLLMNECCIVKNGKKYELVEIEFYLFSEEHPDAIVYPRDCVAGQWYFHQSGVDLTFATSDKQFGGILIRGLREIDGERKQIFGPQNCVNLLWDKFNAFEAVTSEIPIIIPFISDAATVVPHQRWIPVKKDAIKASDKINEWINRIVDEGYEFDKDHDKISSLVFESEYRFIKEKSINVDDIVWKRYNAKVKIG